jgi:spore photoproduct lyase
MSLLKLNPFSTIYIEKDVVDYEISKEILAKFTSCDIIEINHYKDVFSRFKNNYKLQKKSLKIILAKKNSNFLYAPSSLIQTKGIDNFFYTSTILNCIYDCQYCFLQGMYPSGYLVIFVNIDDFFAEIIDKLKHIDKMFLSISYDSDILALESLGNITSRWIEFANKKENLTLEIRTKSANYSKISYLKPSKNILLNWTLTPSIYIDKFENKTANLNQRVENIKDALKDKCRVGIVIDPIIYSEDYKDIYLEFFDVISSIEFSKIDSFVIGVFRMSSNHLKIIKKSRLNSSIIYYPYEKKDGVYSYEQNLAYDMVDFVKNQILQRDSKATIELLE